MTYVSLVEVFGEAKKNFEESFMATSDRPDTMGLVFATISFFIGWMFGLTMDYLLHKFVSTDEPQSKDPMPDDEVRLSIRPEQIDFNTADEEEMAQFKFEADTFR